MGDIIPTIENINIPQTNISEGLKVETNQPSVEAETFVNTSAKIEDNSIVVGKDDVPKADIKIVGTNIPVSMGFIPLEGSGDFRISALREKMLNQEPTD